MGVKVFPLVLLRITFISHKAKLITAFTCQKTRKHTECEERLKKNRLKYKMSRCCFNTLRPSPSKAGSPFLPVILSTGCCRACTTASITPHPSLTPYFISPSMNLSSVPPMPKHHFTCSRLRSPKAKALEYFSFCFLQCFNGA